VKIRLTEDDCLRAAMCAARIYVEKSLQDGYVHVNNSSAVEWLRQGGQEIQSKGAELAAARVYNLKWNEGRDWRGDGVSDIGNATEVRWRNDPTAPLFARPWDLDDKTKQQYVLVVGWMPDYDVIGHIDASVIPEVGTLYLPPNGKKKIYRIGQEHLKLRWS
jgi:hypothetical protein